MIYLITDHVKFETIYCDTWKGLCRDNDYDSYDLY